MKYKLILSDPPWDYGNRGCRGNAADQYPTMGIEQIKSLNVKDIADDDSVLLLWTTWPFLKEGISVAEAWGFKYLTGLPWVKVNKAEEDLWGEWHMKTQTGVGFWVRGVTEPLLICRRGKAKPPTETFVGLISPNIRHSRKPDNIYEYAEALPGPYLEMFCRRPRAGWHIFGNEVESDIKIESNETNIL